MTLTVEDLQRRILAHARAHVDRGAISVRRLATLSGWSQPYMQLVISGRRDITADVADAIVRTLGITAADLYTVEELRDLVTEAAAVAQARYEVDYDDAA